VPIPLLAFAARVAATAGIRLPFDAAELRRATEDKAFDVRAMREKLGVHPRTFAEGVRSKVEAGAF
jgi:hypothetical protein